MIDALAILSKAPFARGQFDIASVSLTVPDTAPVVRLVRACNSALTACFTGNRACELYIADVCFTELVQQAVANRELQVGTLSLNSVNASFVTFVVLRSDRVRKC